MASSLAACSLISPKWRLFPPYSTTLSFIIIQKRFYQDVAFMWARKNPQAARASLKVPPSPTQPSLAPIPIHSLDDYLQYRNWNFDKVKSNKNELAWAQRLVSHVLTAPLTLATHFPAAGCFEEKQRVCIVGARAEATLPVEYWKEGLILLSNKSNTLDWTLDFCGPQVLMTKSNRVTLKHHENDSSMTLQWTHAGYLHDMPTHDRPDWGGFVLYNPGLGHDHLKQGWLPTLEYILATKKPILLTAHSEKDAERDAKLLYELTGKTVQYQSNPFASRITYQDPLDPSGHHLVSPNSQVAKLQ